GAGGVLEQVQRLLQGGGVAAQLGGPLAGVVVATQGRPHALVLAAQAGVVAVRQRLLEGEGGGAKVFLGQGGLALVAQPVLVGGLVVLPSGQQGVGLEL